MMIKFIYTKRIGGYYMRPSYHGGGKAVNWWPITSLLSELWGNKGYAEAIRAVLNKKIVQGYQTDYTGYNHSFVEDNSDGFITIGDDYAGEEVFLFPKEKFKEFIDIVDDIAQKVYSKSIYDSPDLLRFIIDDDWNTRIEQVYLSADTSFFETDGSGRPQFRFERVKGRQYRLVQNDCVNDPVSKTLGMFVEDVWTLNREQSPALKLLREKESGRFDYKRTYFEKYGDVVQLMLKNGNQNTTLILTADQMYRLIVLTRQFCRNLPDAPLNKLPGVIFYTVDEYWNLIPVPLFRLEDKNFVDKI